MNDKTVKLCSDNFETNAPNTFRKLWNDQDFTDVTLATVDDQQIRAHKLILISCSEFFRNIFLKNPHQNPLLYLKGIRYKELMMVLKFIYLGQCEVGQNELQDLLATGHDLKVEGIMEVVNFKETEEPVVDNGTHNVQEHNESDSNYTDLDNTARVMSSIKTEREVILPSNQWEGGSIFCNECNIGFDTDNGLLYHKRCKHDGVGYFCNQCEYNSTYKGNLSQHKQSKHEGVSHVCSQCNYSATTQNGLSKHVQSKHERVRHECDQCENSFTDKSNLNKHKQSKHEGVRYDCDQCVYKATRQCHLTKHKRAIHEEVTYDCDQCEYKATQQRYLIKHKQSKHDCKSN